MNRPCIVYAPPPAADVLAIAEGLLPPGYDFQVVDTGAIPDALPAADYLMGFIGRLPPGALAGAPRLRLVQLMSVGYDTFDLEGARAAGVPVAVNGGANAIAVAEHAVMLMLATLKRLTELNGAVHNGQWRSGPSGEVRLYELWHSTVGIVGMGRIGRQVAQRLRGWEATLCYFDPLRLPPAEEQALGVTYLPLERLLAESDVVTVHVPLSDQTRHLIDARALALMKPSAVLVNTSRGGLVDEVALAEALRTGGILGAGLDVLSAEPPPADHPLLPLPNAVLTPHVAGPTWQSWPRRFTNCFANIDRVNRGEAPQWVVPELAELPPRPVPSSQG
jgi:phosphoglycerate dehydrogenase-like enzyme